MTTTLPLDAEAEYAAARDALTNMDHIYCGDDATTGRARRRAKALVDAWRTILASKGVAP